MCTEFSAKLFHRHAGSLIKIFQFTSYTFGRGFYYLYLFFNITDSRKPHQRHANMATTSDGDAADLAMSKMTELAQYVDEQYIPALTSGKTRLEKLGTTAEQYVDEEFLAKDADHPPDSHGQPPQVQLVHLPSGSLRTSTVFPKR